VTKSSPPDFFQAKDSFPDGEAGLFIDLVGVFFLLLRLFNCSMMFPHPFFIASILLAVLFPGCAPSRLAKRCSPRLPLKDSISYFVEM